MIDRHAARRRDPDLRLGDHRHLGRAPLDIRGDREFYLSGNLATMAPGLPYAIAMQSRLSPVGSASPSSATAGSRC